MSLNSRSFLVIAATVSVGLSLAAAGARAADDAIASRLPWKTSRMQGSPEPPEPYRIVPAFPNLQFEKPTSIEEIPGVNRLLVTEIGGKIHTFSKDPAVNHADLVVDLQETLRKDAVAGRVALFDAAIHPQFTDNHFLFICYLHPGNGGHMRVSRLTLSRELPSRAVPGSEQVVITWPGGGHKAGCLEFGVDGYLYIATGDGAGPNPPDVLTTGQDVSDLLGAMLRIDVNGRTGEQAYAVPLDNPFVDLPGARPEIWAYGLRNPFKFGIDRQTGQRLCRRQWLGNVGDDPPHRARWELRLAGDGRSRRAAIRSQTGADPHHPARQRSSAHRSQFGHRRSRLSRRQTDRSGWLVHLRRLHHGHDLGHSTRQG